MVTRPCNTSPPPPLKFRTSGFLQYSFNWNSALPSPTRYSLSRRHTYTRIQPTYTRPKPHNSGGRIYPLTELKLKQSSLPCQRTFQPKSPWLASGLCCPTASLLTMASSEILDPSRRFMDYTMSLCPTAWHGLSSRVSPICSECLFPSRRISYPGGYTAAYSCFFIVCSSLHHLCISSASATPRRPVLTWKA